MEARTVPDRRAVAFPDKPFSAYCRVCWHPIYTLWCDRRDDPDGECMHGHKAAQDCPEARNRDADSAGIAKLRQAGLLSPKRQGDEHD